MRAVAAITIQCSEKLKREEVDLVTGEAMEVGKTRELLQSSSETREQGESVDCGERESLSQVQSQKPYSGTKPAVHLYLVQYIFNRVMHHGL